MRGLREEMDLGMLEQKLGRDAELSRWVQEWNQIHCKKII